MPSPPPRAVVRSSRGMVASSHRAVSAVGAAVLADGASAVDAALAMAAMSFVCLPGQCGIGGDAFAVVFDAASGRYLSVSGSGVGPDGANFSFFRREGFQEIPLDGPLSVATPGAMAAIDELHRAFGRRPLPELWAPAVEAARNGQGMSSKTHSDIQANLGKLAANTEAAAVLAPGGRPQELGETFRQTDLARTMEALAGDPMDFYRGEIAATCLHSLTAAGAPFSGREWRATTAPAQSSITGQYRDHTVHQCPPPSPGYMLLQQAAILDPVLAGLPQLSAPAVHLMARAAAHCFADRLRFVGSDTDAWRGLLAPDRISAAREGRAGPGAGQVPALTPGDTTSFVAVDADRNAVSFIHSLAFTFGSGFMVPGTGVILNDRLGRGAYLAEDHPNGIRPGRKPMHTLNAWILADRTGRPRYVGNTPGGDGQVQWNMQLLSHLIDHGADPQEAADAPRFSVFPGSDSDSLGSPAELRVESRLDPEAVDALRDLGHNVVVQGPWEGGGSAQIIAVDADTGELVGGSDSRFEGAAVGA